MNTRKTNEIKLADLIAFFMRYDQPWNHKAYNHRMLAPIVRRAAWYGIRRALFERQGS